MTVHRTAAGGFVSRVQDSSSLMIHQGSASCDIICREGVTQSSVDITLRGPVSARSNNSRPRERACQVTGPRPPPAASPRTASSTRHDQRSGGRADLPEGPTAGLTPGTEGDGQRHVAWPHNTPGSKALNTLLRPGAQAGLTPTSHLMMVSL